jgi:non-ribosomal peptide synthetase component F
MTSRSSHIWREPTPCVVLSGVRLCRTQSKDLAFDDPSRPPERLRISLYMARTCALLTKTKGFPDGAKTLSPYWTRSKKILKSWFLRVFDLRAFDEQMF